MRVPTPGSGGQSLFDGLECGGQRLARARARPTPAGVRRSRALRPGASPRTRQELLDLLRRAVIFGVSDNEAAGATRRRSVRVRSIVGHWGMSSRVWWTIAPTVPKPDGGTATGYRGSPGRVVRRGPQAA